MNSVTMTCDYNYPRNWDNNAEWAKALQPEFGLNQSKKVFAVLSKFFQRTRK